MDRRTALLAGSAALVVPDCALHAQAPSVGRLDRRQPRDPEAVPSWVPAPGQFASVSLTTARTVDPDPSNSKVYWGNRGFVGIWNSYNGGAFASGLGTLGSMLFFGGGHYAYEANCVVRYDLAKRTWELFTQPDESGTLHTIDNMRQSSGDYRGTNDRVGLRGHWIKDGYGKPYPNTDLDGSTTTDWKPYPIHTNCGITTVPREGGGGPLGSLVFIGHNQGGIAVRPPAKIWRLDLATKVWTVIDYMYSEWHSVQGCEYDSVNKVLWVLRGDSYRPFVYSYLTNTGGFLSSPSLNNTSDYANICFMPNRRLLVRVTGLSLKLTALDVSNYVHGKSSSVPHQSLSVSGAPPTALRSNYGARDRLDYCEYDGCLYFLERSAPGQSTCRLFKLTPPPVGKEFNSEWVWSSETIAIRPGDSFGSFACKGPLREPAWGGRARYVHAVRGIVMSDDPNYPVQIVRSSVWV